MSAGCSMITRCCGYIIKGSPRDGYRVFNGDTVLGYSSTLLDATLIANMRFHYV